MKLTDLDIDHMTLSYGHLKVTPSGALGQRNWFESGAGKQTTWNGMTFAVALAKVKVVRLNSAQLTVQTVPSCA